MMIIKFKWKKIKNFQLICQNNIFINHNKNKSNRLYKNNKKIMIKLNYLIIIQIKIQIN